MRERHKTEPWVIILFIVSIICLLFLICSIISNSTPPSSTYKITCNRDTYYTDTYKLSDGFIILGNGYITRRLFLNQYHTESLTLQGNVKIKDLK